MIKRRTPTPSRRRPTQERAHETVNAILGAALQIIKRQGPDAVNTNRIAQVAGVSVGSVYQYFPDKHAIYVALHERHIAEIDSVIGRTLIEHAESDLKTLLRALLDSMINAHLHDQESLASLLSEVPHRSKGTQPFAQRSAGVLRLVVSSRLKDIDATQLNKMVFVLANLIETLSHAAVLGRPATISLEDAREQGAQVVLAYIDAVQR